MEPARALAQQLRSQAKAALDASGLADTRWLRLLADCVVERDN